MNNLEEDTEGEG
jgi:hypothetical protein